MTLPFGARYSRATETPTSNEQRASKFSRYSFELCLGILIVLFACHVWLKTTKIFANPTWDAKDETGQFWSEFAVHYRFAKFFAEHPVSDWKQLAHDRSIQYPDEINSWAEFTIAMEVPVGVLYRWLKPDMPFHEWVVWYDCIVSSLSLVGIFFLARALWRSDWSGLLAAAFYATLYPSYGRTVKNLFLREDFAIPLILFALFFTARAIHEAIQGPRFCAFLYFPSSVRSKLKIEIPTSDLLLQISAALFWLAALASWHLTQFLLAVFVGAMAVYFLWRNETPRLPWMIVLLAVGGVLIPVLNAKQFYLSPAMCVLYALACVVWAGEHPMTRLFVFFSTCAGFLLIGFFAQKSYGEYSHVYQLFFYKLRYLGVKPEDPAALSYHARSLWEGAFNTAPWSEFWRSLQWCLPFSLLVAVTMIYNLRKSEHKPDGEFKQSLQIFILFTLLLFPLAWMIIRYFTFLGFATAVVAAGIVSRPHWGWKIAGILAVGWQLAALNLSPLERAQPTPDEYRPIIQWIQKNTGPDAVILAHISESPVFLAYTDRPIIMHSKFENERIRLRTQEMLEAIYSDEETFYQFARKYGADIFIFDTGFIAEGRTPEEFKETRIYKANKHVPLPSDNAAVLFYEHPEQLKHFQLEMRVERFAIFRVRR